MWHMCALHEQPQRIDQNFMQDKLAEPSVLGLYEHGNSGEYNAYIQSVTGEVCVKVRCERVGGVGWGPQESGNPILHAATHTTHADCKCHTCTPTLTPTPLTHTHTHNTHTHTTHTHARAPHTDRNNNFDQPPCCSSSIIFLPSDCIFGLVWLPLATGRSDTCYIVHSGQTTISYTVGVIHVISYTQVRLPLATR